MKLLLRFLYQPLLIIVCVTIVFSGCGLRAAPGGNVQQSAGGTAQTWSKTYGTPGGDETVTTIAATDTGFVIGGSWPGSIKRSLGSKTGNAYDYEDIFSTQAGSVPTSAWVQSINGSGNVLWSKTYGKNAVCLDTIQGVVTDDEGNAITVGTITFAASTTDIGIMKTDNDGNVVWCRAYNGVRQNLATPETPVNDVGYAITALADGSVAVAGTSRARITEATSAGAQFFEDTDLIVLKVNRDGNLLWQETFGNHSMNVNTDDTAAALWDETPKTIRATADGGLIIAANATARYHGRLGSDYTNSFFLRLSNDGGFRWSVPQKAGEGYKFGVKIREYLYEKSEANDAMELANGQIVGIGSETNDDTNGDASFYMICTPDGDCSKTYAAFNALGVGVSLLQMPAPDSGLVMLCSNGHPYLHKFNKNNVRIWQQDLGVTTPFALAAPTADVLYVFSHDNAGGGSVISLRDVNTGTLIDNGIFSGMTVPISVTGVAADGHGGWFLSGSKDRVAKLLHADSGGHIVWERATGDVNNMTVEKIAVVPNGILLGGNSYAVQKLGEPNVTQFPKDSWLLRFGDDGAEQCQDRSSNGIINSCWQKLLNDGNGYGAALIGVFAATVNGSEYTVVTTDHMVTLNHAGDVLASKPVSSMLSVRTADGGYLFVRDMPAGLQRTYRLSKTSADGTEQWVKLLTNSNGYINSITEGTDGAIIVGGTLQGKITLSKLRPSGDNLVSEWQTSLPVGTDGKPLSVLVKNNGDIYLAGSTAGYGGGQGNNIFVLKFDSSGQLKAQKTYSTAANDEAVVLVATADGIVVAGNTTGISASSDVWLLKLNNDLDIPAGCPNGVGKYMDIGAQTIPGMVISAGSSIVATNDSRIVTQAFTVLSQLVVPTVTQQCSAASQTAAPSQNSAAPSSANYQPGSVAPAYTAPTVRDLAARSMAKFTLDWNKTTGLLRLNASQSTPGYKYSWYFGWSADIHASTPPSENPLYETTILENQLGTGAGARWVVLNLLNADGQIAASERQVLP